MRCWCIPEGVARDPIEQARIDFASGDRRFDVPPEEFMERFEEWGDAGFRAYNREMRALQPAEAPPPWRVALALIAAEAVLAETGDWVQKRWRTQPEVLLTAPLFFAAASVVFNRRQSAARAAARRRGVLRIGDGPPEPPMAPRLLVAVGAGPGLAWLRWRRGIRFARGRGAAPVIAMRLATELEQRARRRGWAPLTSNR
jgi:hypothetical protein